MRAEKVPSEIERRAHPRFSVDLPVELVVTGRTAAAMQGRIINVSRSGVLVSVEQRVHRGARCLLRFVGKTGQRLMAEIAFGRVRRAVHGDRGVLLGIELDTPLQGLALQALLDPPA